MISDKVIELINRDLDGILTEKEKQELNRELESNLEAREMSGKLRLLHRKLSEMVKVEPPADLKDNVMHGIYGSRRPAVKRENPSKSNILDLFTLPRFKLAGMFALGAAAAVLFLIVTQKLGGNGHVPAEQLIGTIISPEIAKQAEVIEAKVLTINNHEVSIRTSRLENTIIAEFEISNEGEGIIQIQASSQNAENFKFSAVKYDAPKIIYANFNIDSFSAALEGAGSWILIFEDPDGTCKTLEMELKSEDSVIKEVIDVQGKASENS
jgi:hypothetical protein